MSIVCAMPVSHLERAREVYGDAIRRVLYAENQAVLILNAVSVMRRAQDGGLAVNLIGFANSKSTKDVWRSSIRFNHQGDLIEQKMAWPISEIELEVIWQRVIGAKHEHHHTEAELRQYCKALCGPIFEGDQLEYGKRYMLRKMLLD